MSHSRYENTSSLAYGPFHFHVSFLSPSRNVVSPRNFFLFFGPCSTDRLLSYPTPYRPCSPPLEITDPRRMMTTTVPPLYKEWKVTAFLSKISHFQLRLCTWLISPQSCPLAVLISVWDPGFLSIRQRCAGSSNFFLFCVPTRPFWFFDTPRGRSVDYIFLQKFCHALATGHLQSLVYFDCITFVLPPSHTFVLITLPLSCRTTLPHIELAFFRSCRNGPSIANLFYRFQRILKDPRSYRQLLLPNWVTLGGLLPPVNTGPWFPIFRRFRLSNCFVFSRTLNEQVDPSLPLFSFYKGVGFRSRNHFFPSKHPRHPLVPY